MQLSIAFGSASGANKKRHKSQGFFLEIRPHQSYSRVCTHLPQMDSLRVFLILSLVSGLGLGAFAKHLTLTSTVSSQGQSWPYIIWKGMEWTAQPIFYFFQYDSLQNHIDAIKLVWIYLIISHFYSIYKPKISGRSTPIIWVNIIQDNGIISKLDQ